MSNITKIGKKRQKTGQEVTIFKKMLPIKSDLGRAYPALPEYITVDEAHRIEAVIDRDRNLLLFRLLWQTGLRISEALQFSIDRLKEGIYYPMRKGGIVKPVHIPTDLMNDILRYTVEHRIQYTERLFAISRIQAWRLLQRYCDKAGVPHRKLHAYRHGFAVNVLKQKPNLVVIQDQLGHEHIETTRRYVRITMPDVKEVLEQILF